MSYCSCCGEETVDGFTDHDIECHWYFTEEAQNERWQKYIDNGKKRTITDALFKSFDMLSEKEQEEILNGRVMARSSKPDAHNWK